MNEIRSQISVVVVSSPKKNAENEKRTKYERQNKKTRSVTEFGLTVMFELDTLHVPFK